MGKLIYSLSESLDGFIEDESGSFDWGAPDEEVHRYINDQQRKIGTYLFGRRMYETMAVWDTDPSLAATSSVTADYAEIWRSIDKVVYSSTLESVVTPRTRLERQFVPEAVRRIVESSERDVEVGGPGLASYAFKAGLVDEVNLYVVPVVIGGGKPSLPRGAFLKLELLDEHRFASGVVHLSYRIVR
jgi:dihydrofolate reductase